MGKKLSSKIKDCHSAKGEVGRELLETITSGMYNDPLMVIREYIQNAADAIDMAVLKGLITPNQGKINISVSGNDRSIIIEDNGCGIPQKKAEEVLCSIGYSEKRGTNQRGFRGIGRLGGLAYCKTLTFTTRNSKKDLVTEIEWNGDALRSVVETNRKQNLSSAISELARVNYRKATKDEPPRFFRVKMEGISHFYGDSLLNINQIKNYLSQTAPVPYESKSFSFSEKLISYYSHMPSWHTYSITLNNKDITKPYKNNVYLNKCDIETISAIELFEITDVDGALIGRGWYAITEFMGALSPLEQCRGIRVRQGNIGIGDEHFLENIFSEQRFSSWNIGEIELEPSVKPNARRDGFESTPQFERFLAHMSVLGRELSNKCRKKSQSRSQNQKYLHILGEVNNLLTAFPIYFDDDHASSTFHEASRRLAEVEPAALNGLKHTEIGRKYRKLSRTLESLQEHPPLLQDRLDGRLLRGGCTKEFLEDICRRILKVNDPDSLLEASHVLFRILSPYMKKHRN